MLSEQQRLLLATAIKMQALKFGSFKLKSGRQSPYFFNAGAFNNGETLAILAQSYVAKILELQKRFTIDGLFGPAYKGIPLVSAVATELFNRERISLPWAFNRKEAKDHGEGGLLVGADLRGKSVLIIDDVLTAGTAVRQSIHLLQQHGANPVALLVILDRQELVNERESALKAMAREEQLNCEALITLDDLLSYLVEDSQLQENLPALQEYRQRYGLNS